ncbi:MAG TPA: hypothetical protein VEQ17_02945 [Steroidobacteraceae bacterium]|nr:hypothetical protein [Steroidobacteraceae bacterium]
MSKRTPDKFTLIVPDEKEPDREMPDRLEILDEGPGGKLRKERKLGAGAYDPYEIGGSPGDTLRHRKPRVDLRKLSEWIKTTQKVRSLKESPDGDQTPDKDES